MLFLLFSVVLFALLLCGSGSLFGRLLKLSPPNNPWINFWLGFFLISTLSMFSSFFVPINMISLIVFFIIGAIGLPFFYMDYKQAISHLDKVDVRIFKYIALYSLIVVVCLGAHIIWRESYDTDLYHAQVVRWYNEYGTVPGLGNLHARLAFNSSWLALAALFDNGIWDARSAWIMPSLALLGGIFYLLHELFFSQKNGIRLYALCILVWILLKDVARVAEPSLFFDFPVHILNAIIVLEAYRLYDSYTGNLSQNQIKDASRLLMLSVAAFMIKAIGAVSLLFAGLLTLFFLVRNTRQTVSSWTLIYIPALCAFAIWVTSNMFLSGYLMYPMPMFAMPFDWTMPLASVEGTYRAILNWARMPPGSYFPESAGTGFLFWLGPWVRHILLNFRVFLWLLVFPLCISILVWFFVFRYGKIKKVLYFFGWTFVSIIYWFLSAPDPRFGDGFFWVFLGTAFLFIIPDTHKITLANVWKNSKFRIAFFYFCMLGIVATVVFTAFSPIRNFLTIGTVPSRPVIEYTVNTSPPFTVWIPYDRSDDRTGNSPLPSAPGRPSNIEMREHGNLGRGFRPIQR